MAGRQGFNQTTNRLYHLGPDRSLVGNVSVPVPEDFGANRAGTHLWVGTYAGNVVARFDSVDDAVACYHSDAYQEALNHARDASERELMVVEIED